MEEALVLPGGASMGAMKTSTILGVLGSILVVVGLATWVYAPVIPEVKPVTIQSFAECEAAGYPVMESYPRQCRIPEGLTFVEELPVPTATYTNASADLIVVDLPTPGAVLGKKFSIMGKARGTWYFEASFPITVLDMHGLVLSQGVGTAEEDWMTEEFVPFVFEAEIPETYTGPATIVIQNDNPSGDPERDRSMSFPITIEY